MTLTVPKLPTDSRTSPIKAVLFDKDGTLIDYLPRWVPYARQAILDISEWLAFSPPDLEDTLGISTDGKLLPDSVLACCALPGMVLIFQDMLLQRGFAPGQAEEAGRQLRDSMVEGAIGPFDSFADLPRLFDQIHGAGLLVGVVTNDYLLGAQRQFNDLGVLHRLDYLCGIEEGVPAKPDPYGILSFCNRFSLAPHEVAFVGDTLVDMDAGSRAGVGLRIGVLTGAGDMDTLYSKADLILSSVRDIPSVLGWLELKQSRSYPRKETHLDEGSEAQVSKRKASSKPNGGYASREKFLEYQRQYYRKVLKPRRRASRELQAER